MKIKAFSAMLLSIVLLLGAFSLRAYRTRGSRYLNSLGISAPTSATTAYQKGPFNLTGDEYLVEFRLPPAQTTALTRQMQTNEHYQIGSYASAMSGTRVIHTPYVAKFFAGVPKRAQGGQFRVVHSKGEKNEWVTICYFALDKTTGRVWFYGDEIYN